ncbi:DeoR/GlpR family DNA-binding transcription regulator [Pseudonocardia sp. CA-107938]|uniref:DeoR/GlpR family DNA-binding transcription regulator n=1 Tax=Pseudonocardia sp. CA-107938 TaxID=3240021 RepID=UPI003D8A73AD
MLIAERRRRILEHVRMRGYVSFHDLADVVGISESTVRRDLRVMVAEGLLTATRGGAGRLDGAARPPASAPVGAADDPVAAARSAIAGRAAELVAPGTAILLGPGRSTAETARHLAEVESLTVVTNSVPVTNELLDAEHIDLIMVGGTLRRSINAFVGPLTEQSLQGLRGAQVFVSGDGVTVDRGLTTPNVFAAATDMALVASAQQVIVLADHTKIGRDTMCQTVPTDRIDILITDPNADPATLRALVAAGVEVLVADPG